MHSIPFDSKRGTAFIVELRKYLQFHSTTETLKNPPSGYLLPPVDLFGGLDHISQLAADNKYTSQEDFDTDIYNLFASAHDGHLSVKGLCSQQLFVYYTAMPVVSISTDGLKLPEIYAASASYSSAIYCVITTDPYLEDIALLKSSSHRVSPLVSVDDQDAVSFFKAQALKQNFQDPDAQYNSAFKTFSRGGLKTDAMEGAWQESLVWPGQSSYAFKFGNGTVRHVETKALPQKLVDFNFPNGKAFFREMCVPENKGSSSAARSSSSSAVMSVTPTPSSSSTPSSSASASANAQKPVPTTLPKPVMQEPQNLVLGYYLHEKGLRDVAVLLIPSFLTNLGPQSVSFVDHVAKFLKQAVDDGKKRLVIDVTGNAGGTVNTAYDLIKQLFPNKPIYGAERFRSHEAMDFLGQSYVNLTDPEDIAIVRNFGLQDAVTPNQTYNFKSWPELYGPYKHYGVNVSSLTATNYSMTASDESPIHGYGSYKTNQVTPPFKPENILLVTDGYCSSACTIIAENLKWQGVKNLVFGGRPQRGPMQAIGGVKGSQAVSKKFFSMYEKVLLNLQQNSVEEGNPTFTAEQMKRFTAIAPGINTPPLPLSDFGVNILNQYAPGDDDTPLQFVYEAADCRLFYTLENIHRPASIWSTAARTHWGKGQCVDGSARPKPSESVSISFSSSTPSATPSKGVI